MPSPSPRPLLLTLALLATSCSSRPTPPSTSLTPPIDPALPPLLAQVSEPHLRSTIASLVSFGTRNTLSDQTSPTRGIGAAARYLHSELAQIAAAHPGRLIVTDQIVNVTETTDRIPRPITLTNILATLPGSDPAPRYIIISGHYDSRAADVLDITSDAPGANDDASGVAVVLELARILAATPTPLRHTIVLAAVAGEEQGLTGAAALAAKARAENWPVLAMITNDIVGNSTGGAAGGGQSDPNRLRLFSEGVPTAETPLQIQTRQSLGGESDGPSRQLSRYIATAANTAQPGFTVSQVFRRDRYARGGDHIPFLRQGYPAVRFTEPYENFARQHANITTLPSGTQQGDLPQYVDYTYLSKVTRANLAAAYALATSPPPPTKPTIDANLSYDTTLSWSPTPATSTAEPLTYAILYRETTSPTWQHRTPPTPTTQATLKNISKDDYQFAVEAIDEHGHRSVPAVPLPLRSK